MFNYTLCFLTEQNFIYYAVYIKIYWWYRGLHKRIRIFFRLLVVNPKIGFLNLFSIFWRTLMVWRSYLSIKNSVLNLDWYTFKKNSNLKKLLSELFRVRWPRSRWKKVVATFCVIFNIAILLFFANFIDTKNEKSIKYHLMYEFISIIALKDSYCLKNLINTFSLHNIFNSNNFFLSCV